MASYSMFNKTYYRLFFVLAHLSLTFFVSHLNAENHKSNQKLDDFRRFKREKTISVAPKRLSEREVTSYKNGKLKKIKIRPVNNINYIDISPDSCFMAATCDDKKVRIYEIATGKLQETILDDHGYSLRIKYSPSGKYLATAGYNDNRIFLYDVATLKKIQQLTHGTKLIERNGRNWKIPANIFQIHFIDDKSLVSAGDDGRVCFWDIEEMKIVRENKFESPHNLEVHLPKKLGAHGSTSIVLWNLANGEVIREIPLPKGQLFKECGFDKLSFSPTGRYLAAGVEVSRGGVTLIYDLSKEEDKPVWMIKGHPHAPPFIMFSEDEKGLVCGGDHEPLRILNLQTKRQIGSFYPMKNIGSFFSRMTPKRDKIITWCQNAIEIWGIH